MEYSVLECYDILTEDKRTLSVISCMAHCNRALFDLISVITQRSVDSLFTCVVLSLWSLDSRF